MKPIKRFLILLLVFSFGITSIPGSMYWKDHIDQFKGPDIVHVELKDVIDSDSIIPVVDVLNAAKPTQTIVIHIDSPGGYISDGVKIIKAIKRSAAKEIITIAEQDTASMAAIILMYGDKIYVKPGAEVLFHMPRVGEHIVLESDDYFFYVQYAKYYLGIISRCCMAVFTVTSLDHMRNGEDIIFSAGHMNELLKKWGRQ